MPRLALLFVTLSLALLWLSCAHSGAGTQNSTTTIVITRAEKDTTDEETVGGPGLYDLAVERRYRQTPDPDTELNEDDEAETPSELETLSTAFAALPAAHLEDTQADNVADCGGEEQCPCPEERLGAVALVFYPGTELRVEWLQRRGERGPFEQGALLKTQDGSWRSIPAERDAAADCLMENVETDQFTRLLAFSFICRRPADTEGGCESLEHVQIRFVNEMDRKADDAPPPSELPWTEEIKGPVYRYGDPLPNQK